jgi:uncharacterized protein (TIGR03086 family)
MTIRDLFPTAAAQVCEVVRHADTQDLGAATPCTEFDLRRLVNHFVGTTGALARVGDGEPLDPEDPYGSREDPAGGDWRAELTRNVEAVAKSWGRPEAWEGTVSMGGGEMPATMIGDMSLAEVLLHGWDLARATGQQLTVSAEVGAELGRTMGAYGPAVDVDPAADDFERALGASGRDPRWQQSA